MHVHVYIQKAQNTYPIVSSSWSQSTTEYLQVYMYMYTFIQTCTALVNNVWDLFNMQEHADLPVHVNVGQEQLWDMHRLIPLSLIT